MDWLAFILAPAKGLNFQSESQLKQPESRLRFYLRRRLRIPCSEQLKSLGFLWDPSCSMACLVICSRAHWDTGMKPGTSKGMRSYHHHGSTLHAVGQGRCEETETQSSARWECKDRDKLPAHLRSRNAHGTWCAIPMVTWNKGWSSIEEALQ